MSEGNRRVCIVTGASRGLGKGIALSLAEAGHRVVVNFAHSEDSAEACAKEVEKRGGEALVVRADVRVESEVKAMVDQTTKRWGSPEIVVHNATGPIEMNPVENYTWEDFQSHLDFFVKAPLYLTQATVGPMKERSFGRVVLIGSEVVDLGNPEFSAYVAGKGAMMAFGRSLARELGPWGITVNTVHPGWIPVERHGEVDSEQVAAYTLDVALKRRGAPRDVGEAVRYLVGEGGGFVSGQVIAVNGGKTF